MTYKTNFISIVGIPYSSYGIKGSCPTYSYDIPDVSSSKESAVILDTILSSGAIPETEISNFVASFVSAFWNQSISDSD